MLAALIWIGGPLLFGLIVAAITGGGQEENPVTKHLERFAAEKLPMLLEYSPGGVYAVRIVELQERVIGVVDGAGRYAAFPLDKVTLTSAEDAMLAEDRLRFPVTGPLSP